MLHIQFSSDSRIVIIITVFTFLPQQLNENRKIFKFVLPNSKCSQYKHFYLINFEFLETPFDTEEIGRRFSFSGPYRLVNAFRTFLFQEPVAVFFEQFYTLLVQFHHGARFPASFVRQCIHGDKFCQGLKGRVRMKLKFKNVLLSHGYTACSATCVRNFKGLFYMPKQNETRESRNCV